MEKEKLEYRRKQLKANGPTELECVWFPICNEIGCEECPCKLKKVIEDDS